MGFDPVAYYFLLYYTKMPYTLEGMKKDIISLIKSQPTKVFRKNEILIQQGETPSELFALRSGFVKITDISAEGFEQMLWLAKKYDVIPIEWLFGATDTSPFFYTAHTNVEVYTISRDVFLETIKDDASTLFEINKALGQKQSQLLQHISATLKPKARDKIAHILYYLALRLDQKERDIFLGSSTHLTHQNIANLVGITRETASLELNILKKEGYIDYGKSGLKIYTRKLAELIETL